MQFPLKFRPINSEDARAIAAWRYPAPFTLYNRVDDQHSDEAARIMDTPHYFAVIDAADDLVAFRCFGPEGRVSGFQYDEQALDTGGGLRPDLTSRGFGAHVIESGLEFGSQLFAPVAFRVTVAAFNTRALRVFQRIGFEEISSFAGVRSAIRFNVLVRKQRTVTITAW